MSSTLRNVLAVPSGIIACFVLNSLLLGAMMKLIGTPDGFDPNDASTYSLLEGRHLLSPLVAHGLPSLIGGAIAATIAATHRMAFALVVGGLHLLGGIAAAFIIPAPAWFIAADLTLAYLPMAWIGGRLATRR